MEGTVFHALTILGSLGLFLFGMKIMSESLQRVAGDKLRNVLAAMTSNLAKRVFVGAMITAIVQSSSATTVMIISFVNAGLLSLVQSIGMIMGANIGTTTTAWIISLFGFKVDLGLLALPVIGLGFPFLFMKSDRIKSIGEIVIGFALLFMGLDLLKKAMSGLQQDPTILEFLKYFGDLGFLSIIIFVIIGTVLTVVIQSSSATMALTIIMCNNGWISFDCAAAMVLGENIGTTITANVAAIVANTNAKRAARAHFIFNLIGVTWMLLIFPLFLKLIVYIVIELGGESPFTSVESRPIALSLFHTMFNVLNTLLLVGFTKQIATIVTKMIKQKEDPRAKLAHIEGGIMSVKQLSIIQAYNELQRYAHRTSKMFGFVRALFQETNNDKFNNIYNRVCKYENISDQVEVEIQNYLTESAESDLGSAVLRKVQTSLKVIADIESMADRNYKLARIIKHKRDNNLWFNQELRDKVNEMFDLVDRAITVMNSNISSDKENRPSIDAAYFLEKQINKMRNELKEYYLFNIDHQDVSHMSRVIFAEIITETERLADSVLKISEDMLQITPHTQPEKDEWLSEKRKMAEVDLASCED